MSAVSGKTFTTGSMWSRSTMPALKDRPDDIPLLARYFLDSFSREIGPRFKGFSTAAIDAMMKHDWKGNIREMQNRIKRAVVMAEGDYIQPQDIDLDDTWMKVKLSQTLKEIRDSAEISAIRHALARNRRQHIKGGSGSRCKQADTS